MVKGAFSPKFLLLRILYMYYTVIPALHWSAVKLILKKSAEWNTQGKNTVSKVMRHYEEKWRLVIAVLQGQPVMLVKDFGGTLSLWRHGSERQNKINDFKTVHLFCILLPSHSPFLLLPKAEFRRDPSARKARHLPEEELSRLHGESLLQRDQYYRPGQETQAADTQRGECHFPSEKRLVCAGQPNQIFPLREATRKNDTEKVVPDV